MGEVDQGKDLLELGAAADELDGWGVAGEEFVGDEKNADAHAIGERDFGKVEDDLDGFSGQVGGDVAADGFGDARIESLDVKGNFNMVGLAGDIDEIHELRRLSERRRGCKDSCDVCGVAALSSAVAGAVGGLHQAVACATGYGPGAPSGAPQGPEARAKIRRLGRVMRRVVDMLFTRKVMASGLTYLPHFQGISSNLALNLLAESLRSSDQ